MTKPTAPANAKLLKRLTFEAIVLAPPAKGLGDWPPALPLGDAAPEVVDDEFVPDNGIVTVLLEPLSLGMGALEEPGEL